MLIRFKLLFFFLEKTAPLKNIKIIKVLGTHRYVSLLSKNRTVFNEYISSIAVVTTRATGTSSGARSKWRRDS